MAWSLSLVLTLLAAPPAYAQVVVSVVPSDDRASESPADNGQFTVRRDGGLPMLTVTVNYSVAGTATPGVDYIALSGVAIIPARTSDTKVVVTPLDDDIPEEDETVEITLTSADSDRVSIGSPATASLSITDGDEDGGDDDDGNGDDDDDDNGDDDGGNGDDDDDDGGNGDDDDGNGDDDDGGNGDDDDGNGDDDDNSNNQVHVSVLASDDAASETPAENGEFTVRRVGGNDSRPVTVRYSVGGSASPGEDYAPLTGSVRLESQQEEASIAVAVSGDDDVFEGAETVTITLQEEDDVVVVAGSASVTISDSPHSVTAERSSDAAENPLVDGEITASLGARNESGSGLTIEYSVAGTATPGMDYETLSGTAVIPVGSSSASIMVRPLDDNLSEPDETVEITLTGTSNPDAPVGSPATARVTIADDDVPGGGDDDGDDDGDGGDDGDGNGDADDDGDGLSNEREEELGTDPQVADTDGDGVNDGDEDAAGTDPLDDRSFADADGDLVPDAVEAADGTDANDPQSFADGDGGGTADHVETTIFASYDLPQTDPGDASDDQRDFDGDSLPDRLEILSGSDPDSPDSPTANGAGDDSGNGITNAVEAYLATLRINDVDAVSDHDRDGYPDAREVTLGLNPLSASERDSDGDGVPDVVEVLAGVDIDAGSDSDGDGVPDAREIAIGADPLDANSPVANGALDDDGNGASNAIDHVLQLLDASGDTDADGDNDGDGINNADEIRLGTDPFRDEQPAVWVELSQAEIGPVSGILTEGGTATATAVVGGHQTGTLIYDWSASDNAILAVSSGGLADKRLTIAPRTLPPGPYELVVSVQRTVGDYSSPVSELRVPVSIMAGADAAQVADSDHDGVPDQSDDADARRGFANELQARSGARMQVANGMRLQLGSTARIARTGSARVTTNDIANAGNGSGSSVGNSDDDFDYVSGIYDFEIANLPEVGSGVSIVIPQGTPIGEFPEYRKFQPGSGWVDFVEDANNSIESAEGSSGACPAPGDDSYQSGLTPGHFCIQLTIEDGGPNDGDAELGPNGVIKDPSGVATPKGQVSAGQGGGSTGPAALAALALFATLAALRRRIKR